MWYSAVGFLMTRTLSLLAAPHNIGWCWTGGAGGGGERRRGALGDGLGTGDVGRRGGRPASLL